MSRYPLDSRFWTDPGVARLNVSATLLAANALTGTQTNRIGLCVFELPRAAKEVGVELEQAKRDIGRIRTELLWKYDEASCVLLIPKWWHYHKPGSSKTLAGFATDFRVLPKNPLVSEFARASRQFLGMRWPDFAEACGITVAAPPDEVQEFFPLDAHQQLIVHFVEAWATHHNGAQYTFTAGRDGTAAKRILAQVRGDLDKAKRVIDVYFQERDDWTRNHGSTLSILSGGTRLNECIAKLAGAGQSAFEKVRGT